MTHLNIHWCIEVPPHVSAMSIAVASPQTARRKSLLEEYQKYKKAHNRGTAPWRQEWEIVHYQPGDIRNGKPLKEGGIFFKHKACRHEYKPSNQPQTVREHVCAKVHDRKRLHHAHHAGQGDCICCCMHAEVIRCLAHDAGKGLCSS